LQLKQKTKAYTVYCRKLRPDLDKTRLDETIDMFSFRVGG